MRKLEIVTALTICAFLILNISDVSGQEVSAEIIRVEYPRHVVEEQSFNLTVTIQNLANTDEIFNVKIIRSNWFSKQKEIFIEGNASELVIFELRLLLDGSLRIEVWHGNRLSDSTDIYIQVLASEVDVGIIMMQMIEVEITAVGVTLAGLAIFAGFYMRVRQDWTTAKTDLQNRLKESKRRSKKTAEKILSCFVFLVEEDYTECLDYFVQSSSVKKVLSKAVNIERMKRIRSNVEDVKKSNMLLVRVLLFAILFGIAFILLTPRIVDIAVFIDPMQSGRDIVLFGFYVPIFFILAFGIAALIRKNYRTELGKLVNLPSVVLTAVAVIWLLTITTLTTLILMLGGFIVGVVTAYIDSVLASGRRKVLFHKELAEIKRLKSNVQTLCKKSLVQFEKEKDDLIKKVTDQLDNFEIAFSTIKENTNSELRNLEAEHSFGLISDKDYGKKKKRLERLQNSAKSIVSTIQK